MSGGSSVIRVCASACQERPGTIIASEFSGELIEIFARLVLAFAQREFERGAIALRFRHFARERADQLVHELLRVRIVLRLIR